MYGPAWAANRGAWGIVGAWCATQPCSSGGANRASKAPLCRARGERPTSAEETRRLRYGESPRALFCLGGRKSLDPAARSMHARAAPVMYRRATTRAVWLSLQRGSQTTNQKVRIEIESGKETGRDSQFSQSVYILCKRNTAPKPVPLYSCRRQTRRHTGVYTEGGSQSVRVAGRQFPRAHARSFMRDPGTFIRRQRGRPTTANQVATTLRILRGGGGWTGMLDGTGMPHEQTYESTDPEYHVRTAHPPGRGSASPGCDERPIPLPRASLSCSHFSEAARGTRLQTALQVLQGHIGYTCIGYMHCLLYKGCYNTSGIVTTRSRRGGVTRRLYVGYTVLRNCA